MSNRLGLTKPSELNDEQRPVHDMIVGHIKDRKEGYPRITLDDGSLVGPFGIWLHHPQVGEHMYRMGKAWQAIPGLSFYAREVVIAVAGARLQADFENYAHAIIAQIAGITESELREIHAGRCPDTLTEEGKAAFEVAMGLSKPGPLDQAIWDRGVKVLGKDGTAAVIHCTGFYLYIGTILNGFDAKIPQSA